MDEIKNLPTAPELMNPTSAKNNQYGKPEVLMATDIVTVSTIYIAAHSKYYFVFNV